MSSPNRSLAPGLPSSSSVEWRVPLSALECSEEEVRAISRVVRSGWWTKGPVTRRMEQEFADFLGVDHVVAVSNGTAALHLAFLALGLAPGEEVLTPSLNFVAAANMILHTGGVPRFVDVASPETPLVCTSSLERALGPRTRGICVMHYAGYPCEMDAIMEFARKHGLWVVEDAAHAPGACWKGIPCGTWGDVGCFSLFGNKNLTCGEGGLLVTRRADLAAKVRSLHSHGMDSLTWDRFRGHQFSYDVAEPGFNYRMDDLRASLARVQLHSLERANHLRAERAQWYRELLGGDPRWSLPFAGHEGLSACHLFVLVLAEDTPRSRLMSLLKDRGIQTSIHYPPVHKFKFYRNLLPAQTGLEVTEDLGRRLVSLPLYPGLSHSQVRLVTESLRDAIDLVQAET
ncbi:MAG TPA: DegT/DnrJ/EryC1/StrS aminotransferase family protein [Acidobacteriota bacterium]|nr:DegT/DnrJ/EryC1/StrS aminotransferase family protein [Acidobacteriota bacterium]